RSSLRRCRARRQSGRGGWNHSARTGWQTIGGISCPEAVIFFTVNLADRRHALLTDHIDLLRAAFRQVRARHPFAVEAALILPDHLHAIWTLPDGDADFATRWRLIKSGFSHGLPRTERISPSRAAKGERGIWQRRYWEHTLRNEDDFTRHPDYVHFNPVKHGP